MKESVTYQEIVVEGEIRQAQKTLLNQGRERFGEPGEQTVNVIRSITDVERLDKLLSRLLHVSGWQELLSEP
jgi:hypothetical protein